MKKYLLYAVVLFLAAYAGNRYNMKAPINAQPGLLTGRSAVSAVKPTAKPISNDSLVDLPGIKPAAVFLLE